MVYIVEKVRKFFTNFIQTTFTGFNSNIIKIVVYQVLL